MTPLVVSFAVLLGCAWGFPNGAPSDACLPHMVPHHGNYKPQDPHQAPFNIYRETYPGEIKVTIEQVDGAYFKGFLVQARNPLTGGHARGLGQWQPVEHVKYLTECAAVTHTDRGDKGSVSLTWKGREDVVIIVAIVLKYDIFWTELEAYEKDVSHAIPLPGVFLGPHHELPGPHHELPGPHHELSGPHHELPGPHHELPGPHHELPGPHHELPGPHPGFDIQLHQESILGFHQGDGVPHHAHGSLLGPHSTSPLHFGGHPGSGSSPLSHGPTPSHLGDQHPFSELFGRKKNPSK